MTEAKVSFITMNIKNISSEREIENSLLVYESLLITGHLKTTKEFRVFCNLLMNRISRETTQRR